MENNDNKKKTTDYTPAKGSINNPYTEAEFNAMCDAGTWSGGYVEGYGYMGVGAIIKPSSLSEDYTSSDPFGSQSDLFYDYSTHDNNTHSGGGGGGDVSENTHSDSNDGNAYNNITLYLNHHKEISAYSINLLKSLRGYKGKIVVTSTRRLPREQAVAMYNNIKVTGIKKQLDLYGKYGDMVIMVYQECISKNCSETETINAMTSKIEQIGPSKVSHHCMSDAEYNKTNVIDISAKSLSSVSSFVSALKREYPQIKIIDERENNKCIHIEIPQP